MPYSKKGLSFISNRQRRKEGTFCESELAGIEPTPPAPKGAGYVRLDHSATVGIQHVVVDFLSTNMVVFCLLALSLRIRILLLTQIAQWPQP
jgi:hypothetical protein